jgi:hypothetical protein
MKTPFSSAKALRRGEEMAAAEDAKRPNGAHYTDEEIRASAARLGLIHLNGA